MPLPGRPRNPLGQDPTRIHGRPHVDVVRIGESPGTQDVDTRADRQGPGTIRRLWRQTIAFVPAPPAFPVSSSPATITRALRYKASTAYRGSGSSNTRLTRMHTHIPKRSRQPAPTVGAGTVRARPTVRNRISSFGSRVEPLNPRVRARQDV